MSKPLVSIYCTTYNHGAYIKDTIEGFLSQKTSFNYEIIIHDDASTDETADIIEAYRKENPDIIRTIIQKENQYSKGINPFYKFILPNIRGKYIARCEGDDYWKDVNKLQLQIDYLERHPECSACVHNTEINNIELRWPCRTRLVSNFRTECDLPFSEIVRESGSYHFSSLVDRSDLYRNLPPFLFDVPKAGDYSLRVYLGLMGSIHYFPQIMSVYRFGVPGSWSSTVKDSKDRQVQKYKRIISMLEHADSWSEYRHHEDFLNAIDEQKYSIAFFSEEYGSLLRPPNRNIFLHSRSLGHKARVLVLLLLQKMRGNAFKK